MNLQKFKFFKSLAETEPWDFFVSLNPLFSRGFFLENWGGKGVSFFGVKPEQVVSGVQNQNVLSVFKNEFFKKSECQLIIKKNFRY